MRLSRREAVAATAAARLPVPPADDRSQWCHADADVRRYARKYGWPTLTVTARVEHLESVDPTGWHRPARTQEVDIVMLPASWVRRVAELMEREYESLLQGSVN